MTQAAVTHAVGAVFIAACAFIDPAAAQAVEGPARVTCGRSYCSAEQLAASMKASTSSDTAIAFVPVEVGDQHSVYQVRRRAGGAPIVHAGQRELHYILSGSAVVVTGGSIAVGVGGAPGPAVVGGVEQRVSKGDVLIIPPDTPHWYRMVDGEVVYLEVRFPDAEAPARGPASK